MATVSELRAKYPFLSNFDDAEVGAMFGDGELEVELDEARRKPSGGADPSALAKMGKQFSGQKDSLGNNPSEYSSIGPKQGSTLPAGDQGNGATTTPINFNDGGIETTNFDGAGNQVGDTTVSQGTGSGDSGSGGSWVGAIMGAIAGYKQGQKNTKEDPDMTSGEDGYGKYHHDARAEIGGGSLGGVMGYYSNGATTGVTGPIVKWAHPYMQDMTRDVMNVGDKAGGVYGSMVVDPIGTMASGKYKWSDIAKSGVAGPLTRYWK